MNRRTTGVCAAASIVLVATLGAAPAAEAKPARTRTSAALSVPVAAPGNPVVMSGVVTDSIGKARTIVLQEKVSGRWVKVAKATTDVNGAYAVAVPTDYFHTSKLRVLAQRKGKAGADTSKPATLDIVPGWVPTGSASAWRPISKRYTLRVNPCQVVKYRVNASRGLPDPASALAATQAAVAYISQATGVRFAYQGSTDTIVGAKGKAGRFDRGTDLVVSWSEDSETTWDLGTDVAARGGAVKTRYARDARGRRIVEAVRSGVAADASEPTVVDVTQTTQLLMHELGHVMGLGHVKTSGEFMSVDNSTYQLPPGQWGAGDLTGLRKVGRGAGCIR